MALVYFHAYMYGPLQGKTRLYRDRGIRTRVAMSEDWEVFASILVRDTGTSTPAGLDLQGYEVKSALDGSSFEYQYHRMSWREKLKADRAAGHIFISHRDELRHVDVRYCDGEVLSGSFDKWGHAKNLFGFRNPKVPPVCPVRMGQGKWHPATGSSRWRSYFRVRPAGRLASHPPVFLAGAVGGAD